MKKFLWLFLIIGLSFLGFETTTASAAGQNISMTYSGKPLTFYGEYLSYKILDYKILDKPLPARRKTGDQHQDGRYLLIHVQVVNDGDDDITTDISTANFAFFDGADMADPAKMPRSIKDSGYKNLYNGKKMSDIKPGKKRKLSLLYKVYPQNDLTLVFDSYDDKRGVISLQKIKSSNGVIADER